jgi:hypothetical protein
MVYGTIVHMYQDNKILLRGAGQELRRVPDTDFIDAMDRLPERMRQRLAFMSREHHAVRDCVVHEMPRQSQPISPAQIAQATGLDVQRVSALVADLEKHLFFLVRDKAGNVSWAYPVTTARTPHRLTFSSGEKTFGA